MALVSDVAEAMRAELDVGTFSLPFKAVRAYQHDQTMPEGKELRVSVVPKGVKVTPVSRGTCAYLVDIFVVVTKKADRATPGIIDPLLGLPEEIIEFFRLRRLEKFPDAVWVATENSPLVSTAHLEEKGQFTSLVTITLKVVR